MSDEKSRSIDRRYLNGSSTINGGKRLGFCGGGLYRLIIFAVIIFSNHDDRLLNLIANNLSINT